MVSSAQLGPGEAADFLVRPRVGELLWNTTRLLVGGVLREHGARRRLCVAGGADRPPVASPVARRAGRTTRRTRVRQRLRLGLHHPRRPGSYAGAVLVVSLSYYPLVYLPTVAALRRLDSGLEDVAAALGHRPVTTFARVVLPAISPAVLGGALLVGLHLLGEYGALQILNYPTLTTGILALYRTTFNGPAATLLALLLVAFCLLLLGLELLVRGRRRHCARGCRGEPQRRRLPPGQGSLRSSRRPGRAGCPRPGRAAPQSRPVARARHVDHVPGRRPLGRGPHHHRSRDRRRAARHRCRAAGRLARGPAPRGPRHDDRAQRLPRQRAAGDRGGPRAGDGVHPLVPGDLPDRAAARHRLQHHVPAARRGQRPRDPRARPAGPRRRGALARLHPCGGRAPGDPAPGAARTRREPGPRLARRQHRADRDAAALADRHLDPGHGVLGARVRGRVRRGGAVRLVADRALGAGHLAAVAGRQPRRPAQPRSRSGSRRSGRHAR